MLEVFKRRWKPKRASSNNNYKGDTICNKNISDPVNDVTIEKLLSAPTSIRQIHPLEEEKTGLRAYSSDSVKRPTAPSCNGTLPGGDSPYLAPNICVEGGRIEFIKPSPEVQPPLPMTMTIPAPDYSSPPSYSLHDEKEDCIKECLEVRILELEESLDLERKAVQKERQINAKLQRQLSRAELAQRDTERERRLRRESEAKLRSTVAEAERYRAKLNNLQKEFSRMEDTVRSMLEYKSRCEQLKQAKASLVLSYENQIQQFQAALAKLSSENDRLKRQLRNLEATNNEEVQRTLLERLHTLERKNLDLMEEAERQRKQYEHYLDDIASQVVRALLAQKSLQEEIETLHARSKDLESQNQTLTSLLLRQMGHPATRRNAKSLANSTSNFVSLPSLETSKRPHSLDESQLKELEEALWSPIHRPHSLSLNITTPNLNHESKKDIESPESGNRDEGYSTMSSDMQGIVELPKKGLEEVKEASDETEIIDSTFADKRPLDFKKPDILFIPLSLSLNINSRHSYPPMKDFLPYHHIMRSFSDSHLCLKFTTSPSAPMVISFDTVWGNNKRSNLSVDDTISCDSFNDWWDTDYIQQWLRIDDTRSALQQRLSYNPNDIEDWSMEQDETDFRKKNQSTPNNLMLSLPSIQESSDYLEFMIDEDGEEEDQLWTAENKYFNESDAKSYWPNFSCSAISPVTNSWSSNDTNSDECGQMYNDFESNEGLSKRSSAVLSTDSGDSSVIGTDFTRDFYRLVKFESTKSLTSLSSKSQTNESQKSAERNISLPLTLDEEQILKSAFSVMVEQQQPNHQDPRFKETVLKSDFSTFKDKASPVASFSNIEMPRSSNTPQLFEPQIAGKRTEPILSTDAGVDALNSIRHDDSNNFISSGPSTACSGRLNSFQSFSLPKNSFCRRSPMFSKRKRPVSVEVLMNDSLLPNNSNSVGDKDLKADHSDLKNNPKVPKELEFSLDLKVLPRTNSDNFSDSSSDNGKVGIEFDDEEIDCLSEDSLSSFCLSDISLRHLRSDLTSRSSLNTVPEEEETEVASCDTATSLSSPGTVILSENRADTDASLCDQSRNKMVNFHPCSNSERPYANASTVPEPIVVKNGQRYSFNESASSKDVIDELNRMIRKGEELSDAESGKGEERKSASLDDACCCPTGWVHVERDIDFTDPKARANLLDVMLASRHSSSSAEDLSSCESEEERSEYHHLHRIHRSRCQRKVAIREPLKSSTREPLCGVLRQSMSVRPSIVGRDDFFVRYGEKEKDALSFFDFLETMSTTSISAASSCESSSGLGRKGGSKFLQNEQLNQPHVNKPHLSGSCATSYSDSE